MDISNLIYNPTLTFLMTAAIAFGVIGICISLALLSPAKPFKTYPRNTKISMFSTLIAGIIFIVFAIWIHTISNDVILGQQNSLRIQVQEKYNINVTQEQSKSILRNINNQFIQLDDNLHARIENKTLTFYFKDDKGNLLTVLEKE